MTPEGYKRIIIVMVLIGIALGASGIALYLTGETMPGILLIVLAIPFLVISFSLSKFSIYMDFYSSVKNARKK